MSGYNIDGDKTSSLGNYPVVTIAASDSSISDKEKADIICSGTNDNSIIQNIINSFGDNSGIIQFCNGHYYFNSFSVYDGYYYGLYLPKLKREIILRGCNHNHRSNTTPDIMTDNAAVIEVTQSAFNSLPTNQESYVIGSSRNYEFPYKVIGLEDMTVKIPASTKPLIGLDGAYCSDMHVSNCLMYSAIVPTSANDTNPKCIGIRGCGQGNIGYNYYMTHNKLVGWGTCYQLSGEHLVMIDCLAQHSAYGFLFGNTDTIIHPRNNTGIHPLTMINCAAEINSIHGLYFGTGATNTVSITDFNMEASFGASQSWYNQHPECSQVPVSADDNSNFRGILTYAILDIAKSYAHVPVNIWDTNSHAKKFKTIDLLAPLAGATADRPTDPVYLSQYFDTTLNQMLTWNGSAWV